MPKIFDQLKKIFNQLEKKYREMQDIEFTVENNNLWNWNPVAPIYLFHGIGDELVPFENSQLAYNQFIENGIENVHLELIPETYGGHQDVAP